MAYILIATFNFCHSSHKSDKAHSKSLQHYCAFLLDPAVIPF